MVVGGTIKVDPSAYEPGIRVRVRPRVTARGLPCSWSRSGEEDAPFAEGDEGTVVTAPEEGALNCKVAFDKHGGAQSTTVALKHLQLLGDGTGSLPCNFFSSTGPKSPRSPRSYAVDIPANADAETLRRHLTRNIEVQRELERQLGRQQLQLPSGEDSYSLGSFAERRGLSKSSTILQDGPQEEWRTQAEQLQDQLSRRTEEATARLMAVTGSAAARAKGEELQAADAALEWKTQMLHVEAELRKRADVAEMRCSEWKTSADQAARKLHASKTSSGQALEEADARIQSLEQRIASMQGESDQANRSQLAADAVSHLERAAEANRWRSEVERLAARLEALETSSEAREKTLEAELEQQHALLEERSEVAIEWQEWAEHVEAQLQKPDMPVVDSADASESPDANSASEAASLHIKYLEIQLQRAYGREAAVEASWHERLEQAQREADEARTDLLLEMHVWKSKAEQKTGGAGMVRGRETSPGSPRRGGDNAPSTPLGSATARAYSPRGVATAVRVSSPAQRQVSAGAIGSAKACGSSPGAQPASPRCFSAPQPPPGVQATAVPAPAVRPASSSKLSENPFTPRSARGVRPYGLGISSSWFSQPRSSGRFSPRSGPTSPRPASGTF
eukprot:TRINITY_DN83238_c0_g1_i1.p1 TRINITY_DN83238_c0_g1~~TRINITY_DN83238_c0_g1_i1.p1  ORF type:complete len:623 (-),score=116.31 TRINITY_DN83238_c0_g1_i1:97-1965(-)